MIERGNIPVLNRFFEFCSLYKHLLENVLCLSGTEQAMFTLSPRERGASCIDRTRIYNVGTDDCHYQISEIFLMDFLSWNRTFNIQPDGLAESSRPIRESHLTLGRRLADQGSLTRQRYLHAGLNLLTT